MPSIALGTDKLKLEDLQSILPAAFEAGYRHLDMAAMYRNEDLIGEVMSTQSIARSELFYTSKVWPTWYRDIKACCQRTLDNLKTDYLDLYLLHFPFALKPVSEDRDEFVRGGAHELDDVPLIDAWRQMEELVDCGMVRSIGVANWTVALLIDMLAYARIPPVVNQFEMHLYNPRSKLVEFCTSKGITCVGYRLIFRPPPDYYNPFKDCVLDDPDVQKIAEKHSITPAQVALAWGLCHGCGVICRSRTRSQENFGSTKITLDKEDMEILDNLQIRGVHCDPYHQHAIPLFD